MRKLSLFILSLLTTLCVVASHLRLQPQQPAVPAVHDSVTTDTTTTKQTAATPRTADAKPRVPKDEAAATDTTHRDSVKVDTVKTKPGIDSPVEYQAADSMIYDAASGLAYLYGKAQVNYQNMQLTAAKISMNMDSSMVHAEARADSTVEGGLDTSAIHTGH